VAANTDLGIRIHLEMEASAVYTDLKIIIRTKG
jgi:hypothetical protein